MDKGLFVRAGCRYFVQPTASTVTRNTIQEPPERWLPAATVHSHYRVAQKVRKLDAVFTVNPVLPEERHDILRKNVQFQTKMFNLSAVSRKQSSA